MFSGLAASPLAWLTTGLVGKITFWFLTKFTEWLASNGLIILNIGVANVQTLIEKSAFDKTFEEAFKAIHGNPDRLTEEQKKSIDDKVISAFRKFASFG